MGRAMSSPHGIFHSIFHGLRRALGAPALLVGLWLASILVALPFALQMREALEESIGPGFSGPNLRAAFDVDWHAEHIAHAEGLAATFAPGILGAGAVYTDLDHWWSGRLFTEPPSALVTAGVLFALLWTVLLGGVIERVARSDTPGAARRGVSSFAAACGRYAGRFLLLAGVGALVYWGIFRAARGLFGWMEESARSAQAETPVFWRVVVGALLVAALLHLARMVFDYARIAVVVDDAGAIAALVAALRFVGSRPLAAPAAYAGAGLLALAWMALYAWWAPGVGQSTWVGVVAAFAASQIYLLGRVAWRVAQLGAEARLFSASRGV